MVLGLNTSIYNRPRISKELFHEGDRVGIYLVDYRNEVPGVLGDVFQTRYFNIEYARDGNHWYAADGEEIFMGNGYSDLYTYYPYDPEMSKVPGKMNLTAYPFTVQADQRIIPNECEFLWAKSAQLSAADPQANIVFKHLLSRFEINLVFNDPSGIPADPQLKVYNTMTSCLINMRTGVATATGQTEIMFPYWSPENHEGFDFTYTAIVIPQSIPKNTPLFSITANGQTWIYEAENEIAVLPQNIYTFNMTVNTSL